MNVVTKFSRQLPWAASMVLLASMFVCFVPSRAAAQQVPRLKRKKWSRQKPQRLRAKET